MNFHIAFMASPQDLLVYSVPSASLFGGIPLHETDFLGSGETGPVIPHPENPDITYSLATGAFYGAAAHFTVNNNVTKTSETRSVWPEVLFGTAASEFEYRFNWVAPFFISPHDHDTHFTLRGTWSSKQKMRASPGSKSAQI